jgi:hypothetical protein
MKPTYKEKVDISTAPNHKTETVEVSVAPTKEETNWHRPFWRGVLSSEFGTGSTSRLSALLIVLVSLAIVVYLVIRNGNIPTHLLELGGFSAILITSVYTPAKLAGVFKSVYKR